MGWLGKGTSMEEKGGIREERVQGRKERNEWECNVAQWQWKFLKNTLSPNHQNPFSTGAPPGPR